jgi:hypothetical protein
MFRGVFGRKADSASAPSPKGSNPPGDPDGEGGTSAPSLAVPVKLRDSSKSSSGSGDMEQSEVNARFRSVLDASGVDPGRRAVLETNYSLEEKWAFIVSYHAREVSPEIAAVERAKEESRPLYLVWILSAGAKGRTARRLVPDSTGLDPFPLFCLCCAGCCRRGRPARSDSQSTCWQRAYGGTRGRSGFQNRNSLCKLVA